jgi:hypothetical protein
VCGQRCPLLPLHGSTVTSPLPSSSLPCRCRGGDAAAAAAAMLSPRILSGHLFVETAFADGDRLLARCTLRVWYDES